MTNNNIKYSVVIPVYNSTDSLLELAERLDMVFRETVRDSYEIIMIDDGSPNPMTWKTLHGLPPRFPAVKVIQLMRNFGKAGAVLCGFEEARGKYVILMDDDLQHRPEDIPLLLAKKEHDVVFGNFPRKKHSLIVRLTSDIKGWFDRIIIGRPKDVKVSPYSLIKAEVIKAMLNIKTPYPFIPSLIFYVTKDVVSVDITHSERRFGRSGYTFSKRLKQFSRLLINNSSLLLQLVAAVGISMAFSSILYSIYLIFKRLYQKVYVSGWTSLMVVILITSGLILFSLGVVGEYLIRIINGIEGRPPYIIRKKSVGEETQERP